MVDLVLSDVQSRAQTQPLTVSRSETSIQGQCYSYDRRNDEAA